MSKIVDFLKQFGVLVVMGVVGSGVLMYGLWGILVSEQASVEIIKAGEQTNKLTGQQTNEVVVDVAGAVEKPGVYKLPSGSRIGDALVVAGGLAATADREWVAKTINLAESVKDGGKIYIPEKDVNNVATSQQTNVLTKASGKVNINTASESELDSLPGIGGARAKTIIDNRPYGNIEELVGKAKIPQSVYDKIKDSISIY